MASADKTKTGDKTNDGKAPAAKAPADKPQAEVLATDGVEAKLDANENMSYADYSRQRKEPVITVQQIISRKAKPVEKKSKLWPNMAIKQEVLWGPLPKEDPPKPDRQALTSKTYIMHRSAPPKPPKKGIGSMEPPGKG